ncbi:uncharacterized protein [Paramormyrops kingsleyae]|uniref:uncharacterized protein isoform X1 n=2 Tax=Paramormyrops kingsleyae TaxID=1676925 RepID=UPI000CD605E9|nr:zinc finger and SCAN domain-containing protein 2-like isoform X1 [Paramormyrops kingsleyae]
MTEFSEFMFKDLEKNALITLHNQQNPTRRSPCGHHTIMMESLQRNTEVPELKVLHVKQEMPEKMKPLLEPVSIKQELFQVDLMSIKEELPELKLARESCERVSCVPIKEEMLEPIHVHRVFPDFGLFSAADSDDTQVNFKDETGGNSGMVSYSVQCGFSQELAHWGQTSSQPHTLMAQCYESRSGKESSRMGSFSAQHFTIHAECFTPRVNFPRFQHLEADHKPYRCSVCGKTFRRTDHLKRHQSMHLGEKPFQCTRCHKRFSLRRSLETHQRQCTGELTCRCPVCGDVFQSFSNLHRHQLIHNGEKSYRCGRCGQQYKHSDYFKRYQRMLSEDQPYYCLECEEALSRSPSTTL